jgi:hypothetical protein
MPDLELIRTLSPLGVGGLLACVIFIYYRLDFLRERQNHVSERERQAKREERLLDMIERGAAASETCCRLTRSRWEPFGAGGRVLASASGILMLVDLPQSAKEASKKAESLEVMTQGDVQWSPSVVLAGYLAAFAWF